jgi:hypothetical protein
MDLEEAKFVWEKLMPVEIVTDLWEVRECFQRHFRRPLHFIVMEEKAGLSGFLPLSWVEERGFYAFFPGETWKGRTWLEQNFIFGNDPARLLTAIPGPYHIRYLSPRCAAGSGGNNLVDETGYLFTPSLYGYDFNRYLQCFSGKSLKKIRSEMKTIAEGGLTWRYDSLGDFDHLIAMNISRFGTSSYFYDPRFRRGFQEMVHLFRDRGWLRITTALISGEVAAVDVGVIYRNRYTLMAGGTNPSFPGIAKCINLHHMERACSEKMDEVDFLCGDFNWKKMFHLSERPLFLAASASARAA